MKPARPRVLLLSPLPPPMGGIPTWTLGVLESSLRERFELEVVSTAPSHKSTVHQDSRFRLDRVADALRILTRLVVVLVRFRPHIVHVNTPYYWAFVRDGLAVWIARLAGARTLLHFRGGDFPEFVRGAPGWMQRAIRLTLRRADRLLALTGATEAFLVDLVGAETVRRVPNFIRLEDIGAPAARTAEADRPLEVLFVGWILEAKGVGELLEAASHFPDVRFTLVGPLQPDFLEQIRPLLEAEKDHVELLPPAERADVITLYHRADVFVLPTWREGFPNVVLEAMAAGLPVVATPVGAIPDAVRDGEEGLLVPARDAGALRDALARLLSDPDERLAMGKRARARAVAHFAMEPVLERLADIYQELLGDPRSTLRGAT